MVSHSRSEECLIAFRILLSAAMTSSKVSGTPSGSFSNIFLQNRMRRLDAAIERLAAIGRVIDGGVREGRTDALQDSLGLKRPRDGVGGAQRPSLHGAVMQGVRKHEQPRHRAIGVAAQLVAHPLHAFGRAQIDVDHEAGELARRLLGELLGRHRRDVADRLEDAGELGALVAPVGGEQKPAFGGGFG
ncbi:hypothetical protein ACVWWG_002733 [Bradyrhizobium sp. LB7.2]